MGLGVLQKSAGALFSKMLGNGRNGFDIMPDFQQYSFLASWTSDKEADDFFGSTVFQEYAASATEYYTVKMLSLQAHGKWDAQEPFIATDEPKFNPEGPIIVLTRAKINFFKLFDFWRHVGQAHASLRNSKGVLLAMGIGENPFTEQATISVWDSVDSLRKFAYQKSGHKEIVKRTRQRKWYKEELFARFVPVATQGTLHGRDVLEAYFKPELSPMQ